MDIFPFEKIRDGQREFLGDVKGAIENGRHLVAHAPAGIGKTAAVIAPSLEYALGNNKTVFFLTPKHTQHTIVVDTLQRIKRKFDINFVAVDIIGKQWTCPQNVRDLDPREFNEFCRVLKKDERCRYFKNVRKRKLSKNARRVIERIKKEPMHSEKISKLCSDNMLCPYEICVEVGKDANIVICDYFHIFSPNVRKAFLSKMNKNLENSILIIDEAHNLPERVRNILSYNLTDFSIKRAIKEANLLDYEILKENFREMANVLRELGRGMKKGGERYVKREEFMEKLQERMDITYAELADMSEDLGEEVLGIPNRYRSYSKTISRFLKNWNKEDIGYTRIFKRNKNFLLTYRCLDPSVSSREVFEDSHSSVFMSGTLIPVSMYSNILALDPKRTLEREYESPFPKENRLCILVPGVTTKFTKRSDLMYSRYAKIISEIVKEVPKNIAVFFPAYHILESVENHLKKFRLNKEILVERQEMKKDERVELYQHLINLMNNSGGILLGVQAGSLSEGVDYANNLLDAVIIVGLPLEIPNLETKALIDYYDFKFERGWDYGYIFPAMNRVLQAAGRCIRSETDKGVIVLMDERFRWRNYSKCFPRDFEFIVSEIPERYVKRFFEKERTKN
ncbi:MAG: hypothetical protein DRO76_05095 [Candidatus Altiarchaeales archaeon]|nr:MAG: hypothetical protein DRO76_05095 [Candidatus Altiarchaeales archaeon]